MENIDYTCELQSFYLPCQNFKEKQSIILRNLISNGRISRELVFDSYANLSFDKEDKQLRYANIKKLDSFARSKTNCLVFNVNNTDKNPGIYDKCFVFVQGTHEPKYSYLMYNSETGKVIQKFYIPLEDDTLVISIQDFIDCINNAVRITEYANRLTNDEYYKKYQNGYAKEEMEIISITHACDKFFNRRY